MQTTSTDDLINLYLADETKLYQDWYASIQPLPTDPDTTQFGINESLEELKQRFIRWWQHMAKLKRMRCVDGECGIRLRDEVAKHQLPH